MTDLQDQLRENLEQEVDPDDYSAALEAFWAADVEVESGIHAVVRTLHQRWHNK